MRTRRSRLAMQVLVFAGLGAGMCWALTIPAFTRQGINFQVSTHQVPLYVKAVDFLHRHYQYGLLAHEITHGLPTDHERALAVFAWTRQRIRPTPDGWPVMDDHILHIIIRGHGLEDQMADVFTTLCTYAGVPAFWYIVKLPAAKRNLILSFARVDGRWAVFDVGNGFVFTDRSGTLASKEELAADPELVRLTAGEFQYGGGPYARYFSNLASLKAPRTLRAELQMPWRRFWHEVRDALGWGHA
ncbi:MAG: transglutaminase domain-containing protein [Candidatus Omnitrophica bacterium]|nr:transglutaminase domain-containing protein [Candidatus Omnitrophota bacterium]MBI3021847.1 transglutaminase domain-containing protein [Candidatus Omnitrophota bacterium]